jgi:hypothetical protein
VIDFEGQLVGGTFDLLELVNGVRIGRDYKITSAYKVSMMREQGPVEAALDYVMQANVYHYMLSRPDALEVRMSTPAKNGRGTPRPELVPFEHAGIGDTINRWQLVAWSRDWTAQEVRREAQADRDSRAAADRRTIASRELPAERIAVYTPLPACATTPACRAARLTRLGTAGAARHGATPRRIAYSSSGGSAFDRAEVDVWITRSTSAGRELLQLASPMGLRPTTWQPFADNVEPPPSFSLPADAFAALLDAGNAAAHGPAIADAIADARVTRDRLLTLVERLSL